MPNARHRHVAPAQGALLTAVEGKPVFADRTPSLDLAGDAGCAQQVAALRSAAQALKFRAVAPLVTKALNAVNAEDYALGTELGLQVLAQDAELSLAWQILGVCREKAGDWDWALRCFKSAFELKPDQLSIAHDLGRLAQRMEQFDVAEKFYRLRIAEGGSDYLASVNNLALMQKEALRYGDAIETIRPYLATHPESSMLWNALGTVLFEQGDTANAEIFFGEALRFDPTMETALYNRCNVRAARGDKVAALHDADQALALTTMPVLRVQLQLGRAFRHLDVGDLERGWRDYEARLNPIYGPNQVFDVPLPVWTPETPPAGPRLLVVGEQGIGDEVMFANIVDDLLDAIGPEGGLTLAVEPRLAALFRRAWPRARVVENRTVASNGRTMTYVPNAEALTGHDAWTPPASLLVCLRQEVAAFPSRGAYLVPDAERAAAWRDVLAGLGSQLKVGIVWKSMVVESNRTRLYSPFAAWEPILRTPGVTFVDLQYGAHEEDLAYAKAQFGVEIWRPPGLDLKDDLDGTAALSSVLDLMIGPTNAATNLAAATGLESWLITTPGDWRPLGTEGYPWFPRARAFKAAALNAWEPVMNDIAEALAERVATTRSATARRPR